MEEKEIEIANNYGNVDVREGLPQEYVHVKGQRLQPLCRKLGIKYAQALVGFSGKGRKARYGHQPTFDGVVVSARSAPKLMRAIAERDKRAMARPKKTPEQLVQERNRRHQQEITAFAAAIKDRFPGCPDDESQRIATHACAVGSGRVGRASTLSDEEKVYLAVVSHIRHRHTEYERLFAEFEDEEDRQYAARKCVSDQIDAVLETWRAK